MRNTIEMQDTLDYTLHANGDAGVTIVFHHDTSEILSRKIDHLAKICESELSGQIQQIIPAYQSLTLHYVPSKIGYDELNKKLKNILSHPIEPASHSGKKIEIPVCYQGQFAPDLPHVSEYTGLSPEQIIQQHCTTEYFVHMLGFSPGFLYLGGLQPTLYCPRKATPDLKIAPGSVGIGGAQTGIYPQSSPGGWHIIGRTPLAMFDIIRDNPCIANPMDIIVFRPITINEFKTLSSAQNQKGLIT